MINEELDTDVNPEYIENPIPNNVYIHDTCEDYSKIYEETYVPRTAWSTSNIPSKLPTTGVQL